MSIGAIGSSAAANPLLTTLLSRIDNSSSSASSATDPDAADFTPDVESTMSSAATGSATAQLSSSMMDVLLGTQSAGPSDMTASTPQQGGQVHHDGGGHHHRHHDVSDQSSGADPFDQIMDAEAGTGTDTDALADLMGQDSDAANPADFMAAIQAYQQNAGPMQSTA